jgi:hypothetical protein
MSNHETNGAGGPNPQDQLAGAEANAADEAAQAAPAAKQVEASEGPPVLHPRARTVTAGPPAGRPEPPRDNRLVLTDTPGDDRAMGGRSTIAADRVDITRGGAIDVEAGTVNVDRGGIGAAQAQTIDLQRGGIGRLVATDVNVTQGGIGVARADRLTVRQGGVGAAMAGSFELTQGGVRSVLARDARLEQSFAQSIMANQVTMGRGSGALVVIARRVQGDVRVLLDWRGALAFGAALGLILGLLRRAPQRRG